MHDSGERQHFDTGAVRDTTKGKGRFDLLSPEVLFRLARWTEEGTKIFRRNWEKACLFLGAMTAQCPPCKDRPDGMTRTTWRLWCGT